MNDLISRQAIMKEFADFVRKSNNSDFAQTPTWNDAVSLIGSMPSAQPEIIHCRDCKHHWTHSCMDAFPREICDLDQTFYDSNIDYCSLAERRTNERSD